MEQHGQTNTLVLIGYKGSGKSSTGNTIIENKFFRSGVAQVKITTEIEEYTTKFSNNDLIVIDTPGLENEAEFAKIESHTNIRQNVKYALVVRIGRISKEETTLIKDLMNRYTNQLKGNTILILTNAKELLNDDNILAKRTFDSWLLDSPNLKKIVDENDIKYLQFENVHASQEEKKSYVHTLLTLLNIPFEEASSKHSVTNTDSSNNGEEKNEETKILVPIKLFREHFGKSADSFIDLVNVMKHNNH